MIDKVRYIKEKIDVFLVENANCSIIAVQIVLFILFIYDCICKRYIGSVFYY